MRRILLNRFVLVPGVIALATLAWNLYVASHNHGLVTGRVIDAKGEPVADASVALWVYNFTTYQEQMHVKTDSAGNFRFTDNPSHRIQLSAEKPGVGRSERVPVFLYFRAEDFSLDAPLKLARGE
ncbi:MAG TPA: carboxypeptidase-like regulatory domain-containing protein [Reyranella sp.]|nr:carboxypeptidase-like regulatory domain-containing protein [Reyranella sp.]